MSVIAVVATLLMTIALPAFASHSHWLDLPNGRLQPIAEGQTSQTSGGGCHQFHDNVHRGPMWQMQTGISGKAAVSLVGATFVGCTP